MRLKHEQFVEGSVFIGHAGGPSYFWAGAVKDWRNAWVWRQSRRGRARPCPRPVTRSGSGRDEPSAPTIPAPHNSRTKLGNDLGERLRILFVRQVAALAKDYQARTRNFLLQSLAVAERHFPIGVTPKQKRGRGQQVRITRNAFSIPAAHGANDGPMRASRAQRQ